LEAAGEFEQGIIMKKFILSGFLVFSTNVFADEPNVLSALDPIQVAGNVYSQIEEANDTDHTSRYLIFGYNNYALGWGASLADVLQSADADSAGNDSSVCLDASKDVLTTSNEIGRIYMDNGLEMILRLAKEELLGEMGVKGLYIRLTAAKKNLIASLDGKNLSLCKEDNTWSVVNGGDLWVVKIDGQIAFAFGWAMPD